MTDPFSKRLGLRDEPPVTVRYEAPLPLRAAVVQIAEQLGMKPSSIRNVVCGVLHRFPNQSNWTEYPNVWNEVLSDIESCDWFKVYDIAEALYAALAPKVLWIEPPYQSRLNDVFIENGIGWQMIKGKIQIRGPEGFESALVKARNQLQGAERLTAANEINEALRDLSRRPEPDSTGALQHGMAALECLVRDLCDDQKATLGALLKFHKERLNIPSPLHTVLEKIWGYASEKGRHLKEGRAPGPEEAELVVMLSAAFISYLSSRPAS